MEFIEDKEAAAAIEDIRGCTRCSLYGKWLPGCPHYCAKWALAKAEKDRSDRDREIVKEYEKATS